MSEKIEEVKQELAELNRLLAENKRGDVQFEEAEQRFQELLDERDEAIREELKAQQPQRVPGKTVWAEGDGDPVDKIPSGNRYRKALRDITRDGYTRTLSLGKQVKAVDLWLAKRMMETQVKYYSGRFGGPHPQSPSSDLQEAIKALTSDGSGTGDEYVPTEMAGELWEDFFLQSRIVANIANINMPTNPFEVPLGLGDVTWRKGTENTSTTASDPATAKSTLTATELVTEQQWSYTLNEDAIVALAPEVRARLAQSGAEIMDDFALNADSTDSDTGNINSDDGNPDNDSYYLSDGQDGLRHLWLVDNTSQEVNAGGDALTDADISSALTAMGKYAVNPMQTVMVVDTSTYFSGLQDLTNVQTIDKFGPDATVLTGQLAAYRGIPIIVSASAPLTEADGKQSTTGSNNTLGQITIYNRMMWYAGFLRDLLIEMDRDIQKRQFIMVTSLREAVAAHGTRSSATHTTGIRNILV